MDLAESNRARKRTEKNHLNHPVPPTRLAFTPNTGSVRALKSRPLQQGPRPSLNSRAAKPPVQPVYDEIAVKCEEGTENALSAFENAIYRAAKARKFDLSGLSVPKMVDAMAMMLKDCPDDIEKLVNHFKDERAKLPSTQEEQLHDSHAETSRETIKQLLEPGDNRDWILKLPQGVRLPAHYHSLACPICALSPTFSTPRYATTHFKEVHARHLKQLPSQTLILHRDSKIRSVLKQWTVAVMMGYGLQQINDLVKFDVAELAEFNKNFKV